MKIGVCGTGRMGSSIAQRLMSVGHEVGVWNRTVAKTQPLSDAGAKLFTSPAELVEDIWLRPGICPNCFSSGAVMAEVMTSGLAPG